MTVRELIEELKAFNQDAIVFIGDNIDNELDISWGGAEGCTKEDCDDVGFNIKGKNNIENLGQ
ncbi:MAG: hypothetical protein J6O49_19070 [Bacteroidaceae bacterium]|nr:hypothetical protein [Bacteroidaceae bacterium]